MTIITKLETIEISDVLYDRQYQTTSMYRQKNKPNGNAIEVSLGDYSLRCSKKIDGKQGYPSIVYKKGIASSIKWWKEVPTEEEAMKYLQMLEGENEQFAKKSKC